MKLLDYPKLETIEAKTDYSLIALFNNGEKRIFDMTKEIKNDVFFADLKDIDLFLKCHILGKGYAVQWNENIDLASEYIYDNGVIYNE